MTHTPQYKQLEGITVAPKSLLCRLSSEGLNRFFFFWYIYVVLLQSLVWNDLLTKKVKPPFVPTVVRLWLLLFFLFLCMYRFTIIQFFAIFIF